MLSDSIRRSLADLKVRIFKSWWAVKLYVSFASCTLYSSLIREAGLKEGQRTDTHYKTISSWYLKYVYKNKLIFSMSLSISFIMLW